MNELKELNLWQRLALAQSKVDYVQKEKKQGMSYSVVSHDAVTAKVRPVLVECGIHYHPVGLTFAQNGNRTEVALTVRFVNVDKPTECIDVPSLGYGIDNQDKGPGKAISYAVKYALLKTLGLETGDDPDNDQNAVHEAEPMKAVNGTNGASKMASRDDFKRIVSSFRNATGKAALEKIYVDNVKVLDAMPPEWVDDLRVEYKDKQSELEKKAAA